VLTVGPEGGRRSVTASTLTVDVDGEQMTVHALREIGPERAASRITEAGVPGPLTGRQREILSLLAEGFRAGQIAGRLELSEATVRNHISSILDRLGCHSQLEAVAEARRRGLL
jgi:DNA-binding NarL/FixJ family response regulator